MFLFKHFWHLLFMFTLFTVDHDTSGFVWLTPVAKTLSTYRRDDSIRGSGPGSGPGKSREPEWERK